MKFRVLLIISLLLNYSCADFDTSSKKTQFRSFTRDFYHNGKEYNPNVWTGQFKESKEMFADDPKAKELFEAGQQNEFIGNMLISTGGVAAIAYILTADDFKAGVYWSLFGVGFLSSLIFNGRATDNYKEATNIYNKNKGLTIVQFFKHPIKENGVAANMNFSF